MKVLHVAGETEFGGGGEIILRLAEVGKSLGCKVDVLITDPIGMEFFSKKNIKVIPLNVICRGIRPIKDLWGLYRLYRFLLKHDYTIVHTHTSKAGFVGRLAARLARVKIIVHTVHGFAFHEESSQLMIRLYASLERFAAHCCDKIVTVSKFHRKWALNLGIGTREKVVAIPNGISLKRLKRDKDRQSTRQELGVDPDALMILTTGRLATQKGLEYLINAIPELTKRLPQSFKVVFAGNGPLRHKLEKMANDLKVQDKVLFLGFRYDIGNLLASSDIVVLPSLWEGLSIALLEAMAAGKPIITTIIGSNREVAREGTVAILVPSKDSDAIVDAILKIVNDNNLREHLSVKAKEVYYLSYTEKQMMSGYRELYIDLLSKIGIKEVYT